MSFRPLKGIERAWDDVPLSAKGFAVVLLPICALLAGFALLYQASIAENTAEALVKHTLDVRTNIQMLLNDVLEAESAARGYVLSQLPDLLARYTHFAEDAPRRLERLRTLRADDAGQLERVTHLQQLLDDRLKGAQALVDAAATPLALNDSRMSALTRRGHNIMQKLRAMIEAMDKQEAGLQATQMAEAEYARMWTLATAKVTVGLGLIGGLIAMALFSRSVVRRIQLIEQNARCLRMEQPLIPMGLGADEIGQVQKELEVTSELLATRANKFRESEERLQAILDQTIAVIYVKDLEGRYLLINRHYEELFGISREQARGRSDADIFPKDIAAKFHENDLKVLAEGRTLEFEEVAPHKDGLHTYISIKFPLLDSGKKPYAICGISTDITARKHVEKGLPEAREEPRPTKADGTLQMPFSKMPGPNEPFPSGHST
jgi:PAS domain S-box-containing protein